MAKLYLNQFMGVARRHEDIEAVFSMLPLNIRLAFCDDVNIYIAHLIKIGEVVEIEENDCVIASEEIFTPASYADCFTPGLRKKIKDNITISHFDRVIGNNGLYNYLVESYYELKKTMQKCVVVKFTEGYRLVEIPAQEVLMKNTLDKQEQREREEALKSEKTKYFYDENGNEYWWSKADYKKHYTKEEGQVWIIYIIRIAKTVNIHITVLEEKRL